MIWCLISLVQGPADDPALLFRGSPDFYGAIGAGVTIEATAHPSTATVGEAITLTLKVSHLRNARDCTPPRLQEIPALAAAVQFEPDVITSIQPDGSVTYDYRIRPRGPGVLRIPRLRYRFVNPAAPPGQQLQTTYSEARDVPVTASAAAIKLPVEGPAEFFELVPVRPASAVSPWSWLTVAVLTAIAIPLGLFAISRFFVERIQFQRKRHIARLLNALDQCRRAPDPARHCAEILRQFARGYDDPAHETTMPSDVATDVARLLADCDAARFSPESIAIDRLIDDARRLVQSAGAGR